MIQIIVDSKPYYINEFSDFIELIENKIGYEARRYLEGYIEQMEDSLKREHITERNYKYKVRFFTSIEEQCIDQYEDVPVPQIGSEVIINRKLYKVNSIMFDYGEGFTLVDAEISLVEDLF